MKKFRCLITDDEPLARKLMRSYVERADHLELVGECSSATETIEALSKHKVDLVYLDIQMPDLSGMSLAKTMNPSIPIIFTTAFDQYAVEGYQVNTVGYLLKPFSYEEFLETTNRALDRINSRQETAEVKVNAEFIMIKADYKIWQVKLDDIIYIEGVKDYVKIFRESDTKTLMPLMSMKSLEEILPSNQFMRVHRSFIVNLNKISMIERNQIVFGDTRINISESYKDQFNNFLESRFGN